jgi:PAS domain S-box-containing protein
MTDESVHILHLEDDPLDAELTRERLRSEGFAGRISRASTRDEYRSVLEQDAVQIVLSDYALPDFNGLEALVLLRQRWPETPFILLSGAVGEDRAIDILRQGATDYVLKHRIERLGPAVRRALRETRERRDRRRAEERFRLAMEAIEGAIYDHDLVAGTAFLSDRFTTLLGCPGDALGTAVPWWRALIHPDDREAMERTFDRLLAHGGNYVHQFRVCRPDGAVLSIWDKGQLECSPEGRPIRLIGSAMDVTLQVETERRRREGDALIRQMLESSPDSVFMLALDGTLLRANEMAGHMLGNPSPPAAASLSWVDALDAAHQDDARKVLHATGRGESGRLLVRPAQGEERWWDVIVAPLQDADGKVDKALAVARDVTEQRRTEAMLRERQRQIEDLNQRLQRAIAESHHRIKNHLQVLVALIETSRLSRDPSPPFERLAQHIRALATLHDLLTQETKRPGGDMDTVPGHIALERLIPVLEMASGGQTIAFYADPVRLSVKQCTALSLIVNELVSNAMKHGSGQIGVSLRRDADSDRLTLEVTDEGDGFPEEFATRTGLEMVENLSRWDLSGEIAFKSGENGGGRVIVSFPVTPPGTVPMLPTSVSVT